MTPGHFCIPWCTSVCLSVLLSTWDTSVHLARQLQCEPCMLNAGAQGDVDSPNPHCQNSLCVVWSPSIICEKELVKLSLLVGICPIKGPGKWPYGLGFAGLLFV